MLKTILLPFLLLIQTPHAQPEYNTSSLLNKTQYANFTIGLTEEYKEKELYEKKYKYGDSFDFEINANELFCLYFDTEECHNLQEVNPTQLDFHICGEKEDTLPDNITVIYDRLGNAQVTGTLTEHKNIHLREIARCPRNKVEIKIVIENLHVYDRSDSESSSIESQNQQNNQNSKENNFWEQLSVEIPVGIISTIAGGVVVYIIKKMWDRKKEKGKMQMIEKYPFAENIAYIVKDVMYDPSHPVHKINATVNHSRPQQVKQLQTKAEHSSLQQEGNTTENTSTPSIVFKQPQVHCQQKSSAAMSPKTLKHTQNKPAINQSPVATRERQISLVIDSDNLKKGKNYDTVNLRLHGDTRKHKVHKNADITFNCEISSWRWFFEEYCQIHFVYFDDNPTKKPLCTKTTEVLTVPPWINRYPIKSTFSICPDVADQIKSCNIYIKIL